MSDLTVTTVGIIGLGTMGSALARGLAEHVDRDHLLGFDRAVERASALPLTPMAGARELIDRADVVLLAVKPQQLAELQSTLGSVGDRLVVSILAGVPIDRLRALGSDRIVRAMPNLAALVGESVTGWVASSATTADDQSLARELFSAIGQQFELRDEAQIDALTAVAGSGPGYLMAGAEALTQAAVGAGFDEPHASLIVRQTFVGVGALLARDERTFTELKQAVTSKGGTTEAALSAMSEAELTALFDRAVTAAIARAQSLREQA